jgi:peptidylprolyl isomerase
MKSMFQFIAAAACVTVLTACGGGAKTTTAVVAPQPAYSMTETKVGSGLTAAAGDLVVFTYVGYKYDATKASNGYKGDKVESSVDTGKPSPAYVVGVGILPTGWDQALVGMQPGGTRTAIMPANLVYGAAVRAAQPAVGSITYPDIPANTPLVYDFEMITVTKAIIITPVPPPTTLRIQDVLVGTGAVAANGKTASVRYTGWLYDGTRVNLKGAQFDSNVTSATATDFVLGAAPGTTGSSITGFNNGLIGMLVGGKRTIIIPPDQAYGATGTSGIPPNATLVFDIELIAIK